MNEEILVLLTDLAPRWFDCYQCGQRLGFTFDCPHCPPTSVRLGVKVATCAHHPGEPCWQMRGETWEDLTITPSINAYDHWHGFITAGLVTTV